VCKSEVAVTAYWNGGIGYAKWYLKSEEAFESEEAFAASDLYQDLKTKAFQDLQLTIDHWFKRVSPLLDAP
jgi:hypothetical protein